MVVRWEDVQGKPLVFPPQSHVHNWGDIQNKPTVFPPESHVHSIDGVSGLAAALEGKLPKSAVTVDSSVGRVVRVWDDANSRNQIIYGDTGWRDISGMLINGWSARTFLRLKRQGSRVSLIHRGLDGTNATSGKVISALPSGFRPATDTSGGGRSWDDQWSLLTLDWRGELWADVGNLYANNAALYLTWETEQPWPSILPGTAVGTIPNT